MTPPRVLARLGLHGSFTTRSFELGDLAASLHAAAPHRIVLVFRHAADGTTSLDLDATFDTGSGEAPAHWLKECLLRADIAGRFDCVFADLLEEPTGCVAVAVAVPEDAFLPGGKWLALPVPLQHAAMDVLRHAQAHGIDIGFRVELQARAGAPELARRLVPALAAMAMLRSQPEIEGALRQAIQCASSDGWSANESFLLPSGSGASPGWLDKLVVHRLRSCATFLPDDFWTVVRDAPAAPAPSAAREIQGIREHAYLEQILEALTPPRDESVLALPRERSPRPVATDGDFVFVSYAHADRAFGDQIITRLRGAQARVWFDGGIEAGSVWDEELESRIRTAGAVVVCLTPHYEKSRYCTREIKFADLLAKPILPISPTPWTWGSGLQLMFQELQVAAFNQGEGFDKLRDALQRAAPRVFA